MKETNFVSSASGDPMIRLPLIRFLELREVIDFS